MDLIRIRSLFLPFHYPIHDFRIYLDQNIAVVDKKPLDEKTFMELRKRHRWLHNLYEPKYFRR